MRKRPAHWTPPGPSAPGDLDASQRPDPGETLDCLAGHWKLFQLRRGHRYSTDDLLTAWYAAQVAMEDGVTAERVLDLGCGVGSVGLLTLWRLPGTRLVGIEAQPVSAGLTRRSVRYNGLEARATVRCGDFRDPSLFEPQERFELITGSPPYLAPTEGRRSPLPQRGPCRFEDRGGVEDYLRVAARRLAPGGWFVWVHATRYQKGNWEAAREAGLGGMSYREVVFREGGGSLVTLFRATNEALCETEEGPPLVVRRKDGSWSPEYVEIRREMGFPV